ncbi:MAG: AIR synthase related protein [Candidatus Thorarchaeota archaeon]
MLKEGKLSIELLKQILILKGAKNDGLVVPPGIGIDASAIDLSICQKKCQHFYESSDNCYLVVKSDPITFPTKNPGRYSVIVNANDLSCLGGIPYGITTTLLFPYESTKEDVTRIQSEIDKICNQLKISILGGHTEITNSVKRVIISLSMIGFVPPSFLPNMMLEKGAKLLLIGYIGNEGTAILANEINSVTKEQIIEQELIDQFEENLFIGDIALEINKRFQPIAIHDPTEGGLLGAIYELMSESKCGVIIDKINLKRHIHNLTNEITNKLSIDPLRLISSGTLLVILQSSKIKDFFEFSPTIKRPISVIGELTGEKLIFNDNTEISAPESDELISGIKNISNAYNLNN